MKTTHKTKKPIIKPEQLTQTDSSENLWQYPEKATPAMKKAIEHFKTNFDDKEPYDGDFSL